jgi:hypothetical protein
MTMTRNPKMNLQEGSWRERLGRLLCALGVHDYRVVEATFSFGGVSVEKVECRRCGHRSSRTQR